MRGLLVASGSTDAELASGFFQQLGMEWDLLELASDCVADSAAEAVRAAAEGYTHIAGVSSMCSKDLLARIAGLMDAAMVTDAIEVEAPDVFHRPIVAGTVVATVQTLTTPVIVTFRPSNFPAGGPGPAQTLRIEPSNEGRAKRINQRIRSGGRPDLTQAKRIVSGGRPLRDSDTFEQVIGALADKLGGAVGATRAAVDSGIAPNELQVGQTGKIVAPDLYIAAGISGSTQHMAGIKDSKCIVAINKDPDAPIFEFADLGLVADLFDAVPEMSKKV